MKETMEKLAQESKLEIIYYDVESTDKLSYFNPDNTYIVYD